MLEKTNDEDNDNAVAPAWLDRLEPQIRAWRQDEIDKGRNPDFYIERQLRKAGILPEEPLVA